MNARFAVVLPLLAGIISTPLRAQTAGASREPMPSFAVPAARGDSLRLSDFHGKLLVVNLWTSWCIPCKAELPALDSLAGTLDTSLVAVLALNDDVARSDADQFLREHPVHHLLIGYGGRDLKPVLHYFGVPQTWVVDSAGRVAWMRPGFAGSEQITAIRSVLASEAGRQPERVH